MEIVDNLALVPANSNLLPNRATTMICANSFPKINEFLSHVSLSDANKDHLTRVIVGFILAVGRTASASAFSLAILGSPRFRGQITNFLNNDAHSKKSVLLSQLSSPILEMISHERGTWVFILDQTYNTTYGKHSQNTFSHGNKTKRKANSNRRQKKMHTHTCHCFVFGLLISPVTGTRIPFVRPYFHTDYINKLACSKKPGKEIPKYLTQADIAACMIRDLPVPNGAEVLVLGDTSYDARQIINACNARGFDWIFPPNPSRVLAGEKDRKKLASRLNHISIDKAIEVRLCPGQGKWSKHQRACGSKADRKKYSRQYWTQSEILDVHNIGDVRVVFSSNQAPTINCPAEVQKVLMCSKVGWSAEEVTAAYAVRWQIELFFRESKSDLGLCDYRMRNFTAIEGWIQGCCIAFLYLEWKRLAGLLESDRKPWWFRQRVKGLALEVKRETEYNDWMEIAKRMETLGGRAKLRILLQNAVPAEHKAAC